MLDIIGCGIKQGGLLIMVIKNNIFMIYLLILQRNILK